MIEEAKMLLYRWAKCDDECKKAVKDMSYYLTMIEDTRGLNSISNDGMPKGTSISNPTEQKALKVLALEEEYASHIEYLKAKVTGDLEAKRLVDCVLIKFPPIYTRMAQLRYRDGCTWARISRMLYASEATVRRMNKALLLAVGEIY